MYPPVNLNQQKIRGTKVLGQEHLITEEIEEIHVTEEELWEQHLFSYMGHIINTCIFLYMGDLGGGGFSQIFSHLFNLHVKYHDRKQHDKNCFI